MSILKFVRDLIVKNFHFIQGLLEYYILHPLFGDNLSLLKGPYWLPKEQGNIIITGGTTGLGFEAARFLAPQGHRIIITGRDEEKGRKAVEALKHECGNSRIEFHKMDLSSFKSVREFAAKIKKENLAIHILMNNAGMSVLKRELTHDGLESVFQSNHVSVQLLTTLLLDNVKQAKPSGRIVTLSSYVHWAGKIDFENLQGSKNFKGRAAYQNSKLANLLFAKELQKRLIKEGRPDILSVVAHPGLIKSEFFRANEAFQKVVQRIGKTPENGARTQIYLALAPAKNLIPGGYYQNCHAVLSSLDSNNSTLASKLWDVTEKFYL